MSIDNAYVRLILSVLGTFLVILAVYKLVAESTEASAGIAVLVAGLGLLLAGLLGHRVVEVSAAGFVLKLNAAAEAAEDEGDFEKAVLLREVAGDVARGESIREAPLRTSRYSDSAYERAVGDSLDRVAARNGWSVVSQVQVGRGRLDYVLTAGDVSIAIEVKGWVGTSPTRLASVAEQILHSGSGSVDAFMVVVNANPESDAVTRLAGASALISPPVAFLVHGWPLGDDRDLENGVIVAIAMAETARGGTHGQHD